MGALSVAVPEWDLLKEVLIICIISPKVWPQVNKREGTQPCPLIESWNKDLLITGPPIKTRPIFPHSQSLPSGSFHNSLILIHQRVDRMKTTITEDRKSVV